VFPNPSKASRAPLGRRTARLAPALALALALALAACKSQEVRLAEADQEVQALLAKALARFEQEPERFTLEPDPQRLRERVVSGELNQLGPLELPGVLRIAAGNSRAYQQEKEDLYLEALQLTFERYQFQVQREGTLGTLLSGSGDTAEELELDGGLTLSRLLGTGAEIVGSIGVTLFRTLTGSDSLDATTNLKLAVTQPLLRGFGARIVKEPLTQAERDVVYAARGFERFRRTFAVDVATRYWRILQQVDRVQNEQRNVDNLVILRERNEALAESGRLSDIQVDQARQDELRSRDRLISETARLAELQDQFKLFLGLPPELELILDSSELLRLAEDLPVDPADPRWGEAALSDLALARRLDYATTQDQADDAERQVELAADDLRAGLDVTAEAALDSDAGKPLNFDSNDLDWSLALELDLPIDRLSERNQLRARLIELDRARREAEQLAEEIRAGLRDDLRQVAATLAGWRLQQGAVTLAERRVESTTLSSEAGRADTRDILEAQEALLEAQNAATQALVDHRLAILSLWLDVEILNVDEQGIRADMEALASPPLP
jgi:outer membrane protein TolC